MTFKNARNEEQLKNMLEAKKLGVCPFCPKYFEKFHTAPIIKQTKNWILSNNDYPYGGAKKHVLLVHKKHIENISQISKEASVELFSMASWFIKKEKISGGSFFIRFGDMQFTGATIAHLHAHIVVGEKQNKKTEKLKVPLGFKK